jgi:hypothetical protein
MTSNATIVLYIQSHLMKVGQVYYTYLGYLGMIAIMYKKSSWNTSISRLGNTLFNQNKFLFFTYEIRYLFLFNFCPQKIT